MAQKPIYSPTSGITQGSGNPYADQMNSFANQINQIISNSDSNFTELYNNSGGTAQALPFVNVSAAPYNAKIDGVTDDTTAWQAALTALSSAGGGVLICPPGVTIISGAGLTHTLGARGLCLQAYGVEFKYSGTGVPLTITSSGGSSTSHLPTVVVYGLNVILTGAATGGIQFNSCTGGRAIDCSVTPRSGGSVVNSYIFQNVGGFWTEDFSMERCYGGEGATNANIVFSQTTGTPSFARFTLKDFQTGGGKYILDIQSGSVYDSTVDNIRGNFSGDAFIRIRNSAGAAMEGSWVRGIHTEPGSSTGSGIIMIDDATCKVPVLLDEGNYFHGTGYVGPWITPAFAAITPASFYAVLKVHNPILGDAAITGKSLVISGGTVSSVLQTGTVAVGTGAQTGTVSTTNTIWTNGGGAAGSITIFATSSGGAGGGIAKITFAGEGAAVTASAAVIENVTRPGFFPLAITSATVNTSGTVSFNWSWGSSGAPAITMTWTVITDVMPI